MTVNFNFQILSQIWKCDKNPAVDIWEAIALTATIFKHLRN